MILSTSRFKKVDDETYNEGYISKSSASINYSQEWIRNLNPIQFILKNVVFENTHHIHDGIYNSGLSKNIKPALNYYSEIYNEPRILGVIDEQSFEDNIYCLVEDKENGDFFCEAPTDSIIVTIQPGAFVEECSENKRGIYPGQCFRYNMDGTDKIIIYVAVPEQKFNEILDYISTHPVSKIRLCIQLQSFTNKLDDSLGDLSDSRDYFYEDWSLALLSWITITSNLTDHDVQNKIDERIENEKKVGSKPQMTSLSAINKSLKSLSVAVWILIVLILYIISK